MMLLLDYKNPYWKADMEKFNILLKCVAEHWRHYETFLRNHYPKVVSWVEKSLPLLSKPFFGFNTKVYWIVHGLEDFPRCKECGRRMDDKNVRSFASGYRDYCSCRCSARSEEKKAAIEATCWDRWNAKCPMQNKEFQQGVQDRFEARNGGRTPMQVPEFKRRFEESMIRAHGGRYTFECKDLMEKVDATNLKNFGTKHPCQTKEIKEKTAKAFMDHYGVPNNMQCEQGKKELADAVFKKYGYDSVLKVPEIKAKIQKTVDEQTPERKEEIKKKTQSTNLRNCGYDHIWKSPVIREHIRQTNIRNLGVPYASQSPEIVKKMRKKYFFDGIQFSSIPELAFYIWLRDYRYHFEYQPLVSFEYESGGRTFKYCPDFKIGDQFYEIKGDQFFKEDGTMFLPYRKNSWSDADYERMCAKYQAKHQCMLANNVIILTSKDYQQYLDYVSEKYSKNYLKQFKRDTKS